jgi:hypothetical protein
MRIRIYQVSTQVNADQSGFGSATLVSSLRKCVGSRAYCLLYHDYCTNYVVVYVHIPLFFLLRVNTFVESSVGCDVGYLLSLSRLYRNKYVQFWYSSVFLLISYVVFLTCEKCCCIDLLAGHLYLGFSLVNANNCLHFPMKYSCIIYRTFYVSGMAFPA